jgi:hypothetical protein
MSNDNADVKTDIALIKNDIKQINKFFAKVENSIDMMSELSKNVAVHEEMLRNSIDRLEDLDKTIFEHRKEDLERSGIMSDRLEQYRISSREDHQRLADQSMTNREQRNKEIMDALSKLNGALDRRITEQDNRVKALEMWKYYMMGIGAVVIFIAMRIQWPALFG